MNDTEMFRLMDDYIDAKIQYEIEIHLSSTEHFNLSPDRKIKIGKEKEEAEKRFLEAIQSLSSQKDNSNND